MAHYVYILRCAGGVLYVGETSDLASRLETHLNGKCAFTSSRRPVMMVYAEEFADASAARSRERQLKRWTRAKKEALIAGDLDALKRA